MTIQTFFGFFNGDNGQDSSARSALPGSITPWNIMQRSGWTGFDTFGVAPAQETLGGLLLFFVKAHHAPRTCSHT